MPGRRGIRFLTPEVTTDAADDELEPLGVQLEKIADRRSVGATCAFRVPSETRGKTLRGSISIDVGDAAVSRTFMRTIR